MLEPEEPLIPDEPLVPDPVAPMSELRPVPVPLEPEDMPLELEPDSPIPLPAARTAPAEETMNSPVSMEATKIFFLLMENASLGVAAA